MTISISSARTTELGTETEHPFVALDNLGATATLSGTSTLTGGAASNAVNGNTYSYWLPNVSATTANLVAQFGSARTVSFMALAAHNLSDYGATVAVQRSSDGSSWSSAGPSSITPADNSPIIFRMVTSGQNYAYWRFYITGLTASDPIVVGVAFWGDEIVFPRRFYQGFSPVLTPTEVELQSNVSVGGNYLGSSVIKRGSTLNAAVQNIPGSFFRTATWKAFQRSFNDGLPAFFGWRPATFPEDVHYVWRDGAVLRPSNSGPRDLMDLQMQMRVYEG